MSAHSHDPPQALRERIVDATSRVIQERGMARTRTSAIAEAAGCAEGSIYRYFSGKPELLHEVVRSRLPRLTGLLLALPGRAGTASVRANLLEVARAALLFSSELVPLAAGVLADASLLAEQRRLFEHSDLGLHGAAEAPAAYLRAEQEIGRVRASADPSLAARMLLNGCLGESFLDALLGLELEAQERERYARKLVDVVMHELEPR